MRQFSRSQSSKATQGQRAGQVERIQDKGQLFYWPDLTPDTVRSIRRSRKKSDRSEHKCGLSEPTQKLRNPIEQGFQFIPQSGALQHRNFDSRPGKPAPMVLHTRNPSDETLFTTPMPRTRRSHTASGARYNPILLSAGPLGQLETEVERQLERRPWFVLPKKGRDGLVAFFETNS